MGISKTFSENCEPDSSAAADILVRDEPDEDEDEDDNGEEEDDGNEDDDGGYSE